MPSNRGVLAAVATAILLAFPQPAWANAGSPLMWAGIFHLAIGNALLGVAEGLLLARLFRVPAGTAVLMMIPANYFSAWLGTALISSPVVESIPMDLTNGWMWFWIMVAATFCFTLLLEWPYVLFVLGSGHALRRSVRASLVVQGISYILLFGCYWSVGNASLYTDARVVAADDLALPTSVVVYFIDPADGHVYRRGVAEPHAQKMYELHSTSRDDRLYLRPNPNDPERRDLMASLHAAGSSASPREQNLATLTLQAEPTQPEGGERVSTWRNYGDVPPLGTANASSWAFSAEGWYWGLFGSNDATGEQVRLAFETPFQAWPVRNAVHLPSDQVIFQLGEDQICAFDPDGNRVALLWHGRGPLPVIAMPTSSGASPNSLVDRQALAGDSSAVSAYSASGAKSAPLGQTTVPHSASNRMRAK